MKENVGVGHYALSMIRKALNCNRSTVNEIISTHLHKGDIMI